jgi:hypothetical protein
VLPLDPVAPELPAPDDPVAPPDPVWAPELVPLGAVCSQPTTLPRSADEMSKPVQGRSRLRVICCLNCCARVRERRKRLSSHARAASLDTSATRSNESLWERGESQSSRSAVAAASQDRQKNLRPRAITVACHWLSRKTTADRTPPRLTADNSWRPSGPQLVREVLACPEYSAVARTVVLSVGDARTTLRTARSRRA